MPGPVHHPLPVLLSQITRCLRLTAARWHRYHINLRVFASTMRDNEHEPMVKCNLLLLYSPGNYIESLVMEHDGGSRKKKNAYQWLTRSLCRTAEIDRTLQINYNNKILKKEMQHTHITQSQELVLMLFPPRAGPSCTLPVASELKSSLPRAGEEGPQGGPPVPVPQKTPCESVWWLSEEALKASVNRHPLGGTRNSSSQWLAIEK